MTRFSHETEEVLQNIHICRDIFFTNEAVLFTNGQTNASTSDSKVGKAIGMPDNAKYPAAVESRLLRPLF